MQSAKLVYKTFLSTRGQANGLTFDIATASDIFCGTPGHVTQSVARLPQEPEVPGSISGQARYFRFFLPLIQEGQLSVTAESMCT